MQFKTIAISTFLGLAAATIDVSSLVNELPSCSLLCLISGASATGCTATDYTCQCDNEAAVTNNATTCLKSACSASEIGTTKSVSAQICDVIKNATSSSSTSSSTSNSTITGSSTSATASSTSTSSSSSDSSIGSRPELYGLGMAVIAGLAGLMVVV